MKIILLSILAMTVAAGASGGDRAADPWFVRVAVRGDGLPCDGAYVRLNVDPWSSELLVVPLESDETNDAEWPIKSLEPGDYELHAQLVSCRGLPGPLVTLKVEYSTSVRRKDIYIGVRSDRGVLNLDYFEAVTKWDGSGFFSVERDGDALIVTNISDATLHRCKYERADIYEEFLVDETWDVFDKGGIREWPDTEDSLDPGESVRMVPEIVVVKKYSNKKPNFVKPASLRYTLTVQPIGETFATLTEPRWAPAGLPACDRYYIERPATKDDPTVKVWGHD